MNKTKRIELIKKIEEKRGSRLLVYITSDRIGLETRIGMDVFPMFHEHLMRMGKQERIDLFLYSPGGITIAGYALVNLIREFCEEFNVIIPFKALSCATLISLGANEIIMTSMGQLSPIDPSVQHPLGPVTQIPGHPAGQQIVPVNVEDVNAFVDLARKEIGLNNEESMKRVFELLGAKVHPLALGAVQRSREQISFLASNLLKYHIDDDEKIEQIVKILTRERFSHDYIIGKREAKKILGLNITESEDILKDITDLFTAYSKILELNMPYNPEMYLSKSESGTFDFNRAIIESSDLTHVFRTKKNLKRVQVPPQVGIPTPTIGYQERVLQEEWVLDNTI